MAHRAYPYHPAFDAANFGGPIDNAWLPLNPGTVIRYRGVGDDGMTRELNTVRVTHRKKRIMGVEATVVLDRVFSKGEPAERTFDWYAQDKQGNVWYLGEYSCLPAGVLARARRGPGQVLGGGGAVRTPYRRFKRTLLTLEYNTIDEQYELKWHARSCRRWSRSSVDARRVRGAVMPSR